MIKLRQKHWFFVVKRLGDIICSSIGLIILSPLFLIIAILMKFEDPKGPIFFSQTRIGLNEKPFKMYKIRSMVTNAEELLEDLLDENEVEGAMFKMKEDPRVTRLGKVIRKFSLDELPQLLNVVKGDMSLVGPRPPLEREVVEYSEYDKQRLLIKPGCTGLWQVSGRNSLSFAEMVELDLKYISKINFITDIKILLLTLKVMIFPNESY
ncbi:sugar transferase [Enterococcus aquimarinus]|nr:sugar transferase [Enterococcus aquimarinus]